MADVAVIEIEDPVCTLNDSVFPVYGMCCPIPECKCLQYFTHIASYSRHYAERHRLMIYEYKCELCCATSSHKKQIENHLGHVHKEKKPNMFIRRLRHNNKYINPCGYLPPSVACKNDNQALTKTFRRLALKEKRRDLKNFIWEKLGTDKPKLESNDSRLTAANGSKIDILGQATFKFDTEAKSYQWKFLVANLEGIAGIIGQDFISSQGRTLSWKTLVWQTKAGRVCLFKRESSHVGRIRVEKRVIVPPETEMLVKAGPDCPLYGKTGVVEPLSRIAKKGLFVAKSVLDGQSETICSVINVTDKPIRLQTGEIIGNIGSVEDVSLINAPLNAQEMSVTVPSHLQCLIDGLPDDLTVDQVDQCKRLIVDYQDVFLSPDNKLGQGVLYKKYECDGSTHLTLVAPPDIRLEIFHLLHNHRTAGHFGRDRS
ncbi:hypothetical protein MAR_037701, partial [Mya arenaria]